MYNMKSMILMLTHSYNQIDQQKSHECSPTLKGSNRIRKSEVKDITLIL